MKKILIAAIAAVFVFAVSLFFVRALDLGGSSAEETVVEEHVHTAVSTYKKDYKAPTCTAAGKYTEVSVCECGEEFAEKTVSVAALGHTYQKVTTAATCTEPAYVTSTCINCGDKKTETVPDSQLAEHNYVDGICTVCQAEDPDYVKKWSGEDIISILKNGVVASSKASHFYTDGSKVSVFSEEQSNAFTIATLVSGNLWGYETQWITFNVKELAPMGTLYMSVGGKTGAYGSMSIEFFVNKTTEEDPTAVYKINLEDIPTRLSVDLSAAESFSIRVTNHEWAENTVVFYGFSSEE